VLFPVARIIRLASVSVCLITIASFVLFAVSQTSAASAHQQRELSGEVSSPATSGTTTSSTPARAEHKSSLRRTVDDASNAITSPFSGVLAGAHSEWTLRTIRLLLALAVYGFGLGFLARLIRMRV
jgi:hypothetical protein